MDKVIGSTPVFYQRKDGSNVSGVRIYVAHPFPPDEVAKGATGFSVGEYYIANAQVAAYPVGDIITVCFSPGYGGRMNCTGVLYADAVKNCK